jgi:hypothetical protein
MVGNGLGVVARTGGDDSAALFVIAQEQNPVQRTAFFEGAGPLQVIQLQVHLLAGHFGKSRRELAGGEVDEVADSLFCFSYLVEGNVHS